MAIVLPKLPRVRPSSSAALGAAPSLTIELCRASGIYLAGESIEMHWQLSNVALPAIDRIELSVLWQTEGKGDEDLHIHHFQTWQDNLLQQLDLSEPQFVHCTLPSSPLTYDGTLIRICWFVRMRVYQTDGRDFRSQVPFRLSGIDYEDTASAAS